MLKSLGRRPRGQRIAHVLDRLSGRRVTGAAPDPGTDGGSEPPPLERSPIDLTRRALQSTGPVAGEATRALFGRLTDADLRTMEARLEEPWATTWADADSENRKWLAIAFCLHCGVPGVEERTGLKRAMPPEQVHAMGRGALATGGSCHYADIVLEGLGAVGAPLDERQHVLDFGCSSGRVARVLAAVAPGVEWHGCDPQAPAIDWAREHLPAIEFAVSPPRPPLPYPDGHFDAVYAISIWSHFAARPALDWLAEMRRVLRPGGHLVMTTQGISALAQMARHRSWAEADLAAAAADLYREGFHYNPVYAWLGGDHGIDDAGWGMSFLTLDWLIAHASPEWQAALYRPARAEGVQDVAVLERR